MAMLNYQRVEEQLKMISIYTLQASSSFSVDQSIWDPDSSKLDSQTWQAIGKSDFVYPFPSIPNVFGTLGPRLSQLVDGSVPWFIINPWSSLSYLYTDVPDSSCDSNSRLSNFPTETEKTS